MSSGSPGPTRARKAALNPLWLPGKITTSPAPGAVMPAVVTPASLAANQARRSVNPEVEGPISVARLRAARLNAERISRSGSSCGSGKPEFRSMAPGMGGRRAEAICGALECRGPSAAVCQE